MKEHVPPTGSWMWVDVRDVALAHVRAIERPEAAGKRFLLVGGYWTNKEMIEIIRDEFPALRHNLPENAESDMPKNVFKYDVSPSENILGLRYRAFKPCILDTVKSLQEIGVESSHVHT